MSREKLTYLIAAILFAFGSIVVVGALLVSSWPSFQNDDAKVFLGFCVLLGFASNTMVIIFMLQRVIEKWLLKQTQKRHIQQDQESNR